MKALILDHMVAQVSLEDFPVAEPLFWVDCDENCVAGMNYENGGFLNPPVLEKSKEEILSQELPSYSDKVDALWDLLTKNDNAKLNETQAKQEKALEKFSNSL